MNYLDLRSVPDWEHGMLALMYHAVESPPLLHPLRGLYVEPSLLETQLRELIEAEVELVSLGDWARQPGLSRRRAVVTFDDAFRNVLKQALPVLKRCGVRATTYVVAGEVGGTNSWDLKSGAQMRPLMDRADLLAWQEAGQEIGSHTLTHCDLTAMSAAQARSEVFESKKRIEDLVGRPVRHFCYPYGKWNPAVRALVADAGYETATTTEVGLNDADADPLLLRRYFASHRRPYRTAMRGALRRAVGLRS